jgi:hypothetical protein
MGHRNGTGVMGRHGEPRQQAVKMRQGEAAAVMGPL